MRRIFVCLLLLVVGCRAQAPVPAELQQKIEKQVRATYNYPPYVDVSVSERKPSKDFTGYDDVTITLSFRGQAQTRKMLISKDGQSLIAVTRMDLTKDPLAETMAKINMAGRPVRGNKSAKVTIVVFDDFQCPYCSKVHQTLLSLMQSYGDRIKIIYKDYPLYDIHPWAERAALDSGCLARQGDDAYWEFADYVHANPLRIRGENRPLPDQLAEVDKITLEVGKHHGLDLAKLGQCVQSHATKEELSASVKEAEALGVESTPVIFIDGMKLDGAIPDEEFRLILDKELKAVEGAGKPAPGLQ